MTLSASFWDADEATAGLSPLACCLYLRARNVSLVGVLEQSPRAMAARHRGVTEADVLEAIDELGSRRLARWWPELEVLALAGVAAALTGTQKIAAERELAALRPDVADYCLTPPDPRGMGEGSHDSRKQEQQHQHEQHGEVGALPLRLELVELTSPKRDEHADLIDAVMLELTKACRELTGRSDAGPRLTCETNRAMVRKLINRRPKVDGVTDVEVWRKVIAGQLDSVRRDQGSWKYLALSTITRPVNFVRLRDDTGGKRRAGGRTWTPDDWGSD